MAESDFPVAATKADIIEQDAKAHVKELKEFYTHLAIFLVVNIVLVVINLLTSPGYFWAIWPIMGWSIGILAHAVQLFGIFGIGGHAWEERKVKELVLQRKQGLSAEEVRTLLKQELTSTKQIGTVDEWERLLQRLENLEAIVTSHDWDEMQEQQEARRSLSKDNPPEADSDDLASKTARLSRRVR